MNFPWRSVLAIGEAAAKVYIRWTDPAVKVVDADIVGTNSNGRYPSDHFPVTATLSID